MNGKAMLKSELARAAGVSNRTFSRWLRTEKDVLASMGVHRTARLLPPPSRQIYSGKICLLSQEKVFYSKRMGSAWQAVESRHKI